MKLNKNRYFILIDKVIYRITFNMFDNKTILEMNNIQ